MLLLKFARLLFSILFCLMTVRLLFAQVCDITIDLGDVDVGTDAFASIKITNTGDSESLLVNNIQYEGAADFCLNTTTCGNFFGPGSSCTIFTRDRMLAGGQRDARVFFDIVHSPIIGQSYTTSHCG